MAQQLTTATVDLDASPATTADTYLHAAKAAERVYGTERKTRRAVREARACGTTTNRHRQIEESVYYLANSSMSIADGLVRIANHLRNTKPAPPECPAVESGDRIRFMWHDGPRTGTVTEVWEGVFDSRNGRMNAGVTFWDERIDCERKADIALSWVLEVLPEKTDT